MNWILRFIGFVLFLSSMSLFFLPSPYWYLSILSFVLLLGIVFASMISDIADVTSEFVSK